MSTWDHKSTKFHIGDIVRENEIIAHYEKSPMIGIVIDVERACYTFNGIDEGEMIVEDKLTIYWPQMGFIEDLPAELVHLISRSVVNKENN